MEPSSCLGSYPMAPLQYWGIHLCPIGLEYLSGFSERQEFWKTILSCLDKTGKSFLLVCILFVQFGHHTVNNQGKDGFSSKWLTFARRVQILMKVLWCPLLFLEVDWCCQEQTCLTVVRSLMFLKHFKCLIACKSLKCLKITYLFKIYLYMSL